MLFVIQALDRPDGTAKRQPVYAAHRAHLDTAADYGVTLVMSGPLVADDGTTPIGSMFVVEAEDRAAAEAFNKADPFYAAGIWGPVSIHGFINRRAQQQ
ncbi:MAG TPA: YciI family protein [Xanthobacteraceae bacterium]|jgi:hypothetical protein|nr:YciI family protein [Xanthobacteraceae bacterium]